MLKKNWIDYAILAPSGVWCLAKKNALSLKSFKKLNKYKLSKARKLHVFRELILLSRNIEEKANYRFDEELLMDILFMMWNLKFADEDVTIYWSNKENPIIVELTENLYLLLAPRVESH